MYHGDARQTVLDDLHPGIVYSFRVKSTNLVGDSDWSNTFSFLMVDNPSAPLELTVA